MLWAYLIPHMKNDYWMDVYVLNKEEERDVDDPTLAFEIFYYNPKDPACQDNFPENVVKDAPQAYKDKGHYVDKDYYELYVPKRFSEEELLEHTKTLIKELDLDDNPELVAGEEHDFIGTNEDSINVLKAQNTAKKMGLDID